MRTPASPRRESQLALFQPTPSTPLWQQLPWEVRQQALQLLARLLGEHGARAAEPRAPREASDE